VVCKERIRTGSYIAHSHGYLGTTAKRGGSVEKVGGGGSVIFFIGKAVETLFMLKSVCDGKPKRYWRENARKQLK